MIGIELSAADKVATRDILLSGYPSWPAVQTKTAPGSTAVDDSVGALEKDVYNNRVSE